MSSRYSKPCNLIQSFIYQQYSLHLLQLCVKMLGEITQLIRQSQEGAQGVLGVHSIPQQESLGFQGGLGLLATGASSKAGR